MRNFLIFFFVILLCLLSFLAAEEKREDEPSLPERRGLPLDISLREKKVFELLVPDGKWGEPLYLYSKTGIPYRCYVRASTDLPISCRRTEEGQETLEALQVKRA